MDGKKRGKGETGKDGRGIERGEEVRIAEVGRREGVRRDMDGRMGGEQGRGRNGRERKW